MRIKDGIPPTGHVHIRETKSVVVTCISPTSDSYLKLVLLGPCSTRLLCLDPVNPSSGSASHKLKVPYKAYGPWKSPQYRQSLPKNVAKIHSSTPSTRTIALASGVDILCKVVLRPVVRRRSSESYHWQLTSVSSVLRARGATRSSYRCNSQSDQVPHWP